MFYEKWTDKEEKKKKKKKIERTYYSNFDETELQPIKLENFNYDEFFGKKIIFLKLFLFFQVHLFRMKYEW